MNPSLLGLLSILLIAGSGYLWYRGIRDVALPRNRSLFVACWAAAAGLGVAALATGASGIAAVFAGLGSFVGSFLVLLVGISRQKVSPEAITVGAMLPHFEAVDEDGATFESSSLKGHPVLIKFFRGHW